MIETIYNMFYNDVFGAIESSNNFMVHEASLILTYIVLGLFLMLIYKIIVSIIGRFVQ